MGVRVAHPKERPVDLVLRHDLTEPLEEVGLRQSVGEVERLLKMNGGGNDITNQRVHRVEAECLQHLVHRGRTRTEVAPCEIGLCINTRHNLF